MVIKVDGGRPSDAAWSAGKAQEQKAEPVQKPESVSPDLLRNVQEPETWQRAAQEYARLFKSLDPLRAAEEAALSVEPEPEREAKKRAALEPARRLLNTVPTSSWPTARTYLTYAAIETPVLLLLCESRYLGWQDALCAKAAFGTAQDVKDIIGGAKNAEANLNVNAALSWAAQPRLLTKGLSHEGNLQTVEELFRQGASAAYDNNNLFTAVTESGDFDIARAFARRAASCNINIERWMNWAQGNNRPKLYENMRRLYWEYGRYQAVDYETLVETKALSDKSKLDIIFNFAARRVSEIYEYGNPRQAVKTDYDFENYAEDAIEAARGKLIELGGQPSAYDGSAPSKRSIAKPKLGLSGGHGS